MRAVNAIESAINFVGSPGALAAAVGVSPQVVSNWRRRGRVSVTECAKVEAATGGAVTRYDLRPDIFGPCAEQAQQAA